MTGGKSSKSEGFCDERCWAKKERQAAVDLPFSSIAKKPGFESPTAIGGVREEVLEGVSQRSGSRAG